MWLGSQCDQCRAGNTYLLEMPRGLCADVPGDYGKLDGSAELMVSDW